MATCARRALCAVLSCWCKQTMLPFLIAAPLYLYVVDRGLVVRYVACLAGIGIVVSAVLILSFGGHAMWFHMVTIPSSQHWQEVDISKPLALWHAFGADGR